jgi:hypothetical protein
MLPSQTGDCIAEDVNILFTFVFQYHEAGVLASNKKTVLTHHLHPLFPDGKDKMT